MDRSDVELMQIEADSLFFNEENSNKSHNNSRQGVFKIKKNYLFKIKYFIPLKCSTLMLLLFIFWVNYFSFKKAKFARNYPIKPSVYIFK